MQTTIPELDKRSTKNSEDIVELKRVVNRTTKVVFGNGEKGMDEMVRNIGDAISRLETSFKEYKENHEKEEKYQREKKDKYGLMVAGALLTNIVTLVGIIVTWISKIAPLIKYIETQQMVGR